FSLLLPRPPTSTLFPYTTLFRSLDGDGLADLEVDLGRQGTALRGRGLRAATLRRSDLLGLDERLQHVEGLFEAQRRWVVGVAHEDRKSTRLNSSHVKISYAVFCL